jgi:hypothetical protein
MGVPALRGALATMGIHANFAMRSKALRGIEGKA